MTTELAPIAIFAYNRKDNLERMLSSLQKCNGFKESPLIIFVDGAKGEADFAAVKEVQDYVRGLDFSKLELVIRDNNNGLKASIFAGVSDVCKRYGRVIVLEDDLLLSPVALDYFNNALDKYENEPRVWSITGYQFETPALKATSHALILPFTHSWGWATWERAWKQFDIAMDIDSKDLNSGSFHKAFDVFELRDYKNMINLARKGLINSWYIMWYYKIFTEQGVSVFPPQSYISNTGIIEGGTHASILNPYRYLVKRKKPSQTLCELPDRIKIDYWALDIMISSWDARVQKMISHLGRIKRIAKYLIKKIRLN